MAQEFNSISAYVEQLKKQTSIAAPQEMAWSTADRESEGAIANGTAGAVELSKNFAAQSLPAVYERLTGRPRDRVDN